MGLQALPSADEYEQLKRARKAEIARRIEEEKQAALERGRLARVKELQKETDKSQPPTALPAAEVKGHSRQGSGVSVQDEGWKPAEVARGASDDPIVQQMNNIRAFIKEAKQADRWDEVKTLESNLRELQQLYWQEKQKGKTAKQHSPASKTSSDTSGSSIYRSVATNQTDQSKTDPMLQQMLQVKEWIKLAKQEGRKDDAALFEQNLSELRQMHKFEREKAARSELQSPVQVPQPSSFPVVQPQRSSQSQVTRKTYTSYTPSSESGSAISSSSQPGVPERQQVTKPSSLNPFDDDYT